MMMKGHLVIVTASHFAIIDLGDINVHIYSIRTLVPYLSAIAPLWVTFKIYVNQVIKHYDYIMITRIICT